MGLILGLCAASFADTPGPVLNKTCPTSQWMWQIVPGQQPQCKQPYYSDIAGPVPAGQWGGITGTLSNQTDLQNALNAKQNIGNYLTGISGDVAASGPGVGVATLANTAVTAGSYTSANITVDSKGRVTAAANGGGSPVITVTASSPLFSSGGATPNLTIQTASGSQPGALSSADWTTFNSKQSSLSFGNLTAAGTDGISVTGGTGAVIGSGTSVAQQVSDASHNGYLSSTDWGTFNAKQGSGNYLTALTGGVSAAGPGSSAATVNSVGGSSAAAVGTGTVLANAATDANTISTIVKRDGSGNFSAGTISAGLSGNATTATALAANPTDCAGGNFANAIAANGNLTCAVPAGADAITELTSDVTAIGPGSAAATVVSVGGSTASAVNTATVLANNATDANTSSAIVKRDGSGNFTAGTIVASLSGNASTATALAANPTDCGAGNFATAIAANGNLTCAVPTGTGVTSVTGTPPIVSSGGATPAISITGADFTAAGTDGIVVTNGTGALVSAASIAQHVADVSHNGYLTATDWGTFNGKQNSGNYVTALTGDVAASGPGSAAATLATVNSNVGSFTNASVTVNGKGLVTAASSGATPEVPLTFSTGLTRSVNTVTVNTSQNIATLSNLTTNGFVKTGGSAGTLSVDTSTYLTGNQTITLSGNVSGSGSTAITTTIGSGVVTNTMLAGSIDLTTKVTGVLPVANGGAAHGFIVPTSQAFSASGTFNMIYAFVITSGSATLASTYTNNGVTFTTYATVASATLVFMSGSGPPAASGTLTKSAGTGDSTLTFTSFVAPIYLKVKAVGAGGGGSGGGGGSNGSAGSASTTFGSSLITAAAGSGANGAASVGGAGGAATVTAPATPIIAVSGATGSGSNYSFQVGAAGTNYATGSPGTASCLGGAGAGAGNGGSVAGIAGGGGGGGSITSGSATALPGAAGGAGACVEAFVPNPSAAYNVTIGTGGGGGAGAGAGTAGSAGGNGYVGVEAHYQ